MEIVRDEKSVVANGRGGVPYLELQLSKSTCAAGTQVSGVVVFHLGRPTDIRSLTISLSGRETPYGASLSRSPRRTASFFSREILLSGMQLPRFTYERLSQVWNAFLGRDRGRTLSPGEHTYPFSIQLPASLPSSYQGNAGSVAYTVTVRAHFPIRRAVRISKDVRIVAIPRSHRARPVALTYPTADGSVHANEVSVGVELPGRAVARGTCVTGRINVSNPKCVPIREVAISLENCEWVRLASQRELQRQTVDRQVVKPGTPEVASFETQFELKVPEDAAPTVEGTTISVLWLLRMRLDTDPAVEFKTPIFVYASLPDQQPQRCDAGGAAPHV
jgi:hypothetical protein